MSKFAKGKSWIEHRLADTFESDGRQYTVNLIARKGTGVQGFRVTVVFIPHDESPVHEVELPNAASTVEVHQLSRELSDQQERLADLLGRGASP